MSAARDASASVSRWHVLVLGLAPLHHVDHGVRGTHVGWPLTPDAPFGVVALAVLTHRGARVAHLALRAG